MTGDNENLKIHQNLIQINFDPSEEKGILSLNSN